MTSTEYVFKNADHSSDFRKNFEEHIRSRLNLSVPIDVLECGVMDGRTAIWIAETLLTNPYSTYTGIDLWLAENAVANLKRFKKVTLIKSDSKKAMRWINRKFDLIYLDSKHDANHVIIESSLAWGMAKFGGIIVWDDYNNEDYPGVKLAVNSFLACLKHGEDYTKLFENKQLGVKVFQR